MMLLLCPLLPVCVTLNYKINAVNRKCSSRPLGGTRTLLTASLSKHHKQICVCLFFYVHSQYLCVFIQAIVCFHDYFCELWVSQRFICKARQLQLHNRHTHAHSDEQFECPVYTRVCMCGIGSLHHLYVVGCFSCSPAFASPALLHHAADHLPRLVSLLQAKACYVAPLCQAAPGHETLLLLHNQLREFQQIDVWNNFIKSRCLFCFVVGEDYEVNPW